MIIYGTDYYIMHWINFFNQYVFPTEIPKDFNKKRQLKINLNSKSYVSTSMSKG